MANAEHTSAAYELATLETSGMNQIEVHTAIRLYELATANKDDALRDAASKRLQAILK